MLDINLKQLEVFVTAAEYGSFTRAADVLYLSQSTVSSHIRGLEETLGSPLFDRSAKRKVALTETGERIYPRHGRSWTAAGCCKRPCRKRRGLC